MPSSREPPAAKPPKRGTVLDFDGLRDAAKQARAEARLTQAETAARVAEHNAERARPPSPSAISNAERETGPAYAALQLDIIGALTGARLTGPLYRVD